MRAEWVSSAARRRVWVWVWVWKSGDTRRHRETLRAGTHWVPALSLQ